MVPGAIISLCRTFAERLTIYGPEVVNRLSGIESPTTARTELAWTVNALTSIGEQASLLRQRRPVGTVYVALPATMPLYSFVLFAMGAALPGNQVVIRPASASRGVLSTLLERCLPSSEQLRVVHSAWDEWERVAQADADGFVFVGSRPHADALDTVLPERVRLLYQGPGVCAHVVAPPCDVSAVARRVLSDRLFNSGQDCLAAERVYVARGCADEFMAELLRLTEEKATGPAGEELLATPLLYANSARKWLYRLAAGMSGVAVLTRPVFTGDALLPVIVTAPPDSPVVLGEKYCPILPVVVYDNEDDLVRMLRLGRYALGLTIHGHRRIPYQLDFAHVAVNRSHYELEHPNMPFGGYRDSTFVRQFGKRRAGPALVAYEMSMNSEESQ